MKVYAAFDGVEFQKDGTVKVLQRYAVLLPFDPKAEKGDRIKVKVCGRGGIDTAVNLNVSCRTFDFVNDYIVYSCHAVDVWAFNLKPKDDD